MFEKKEWFKSSGINGPFGENYMMEFDVKQERTEVEIRSLKTVLKKYTEEIGHVPRVLDLASGSGRIGGPLAEAENALVVSADLHMHALLDHKDKDSTHPVLADMRHLPFANDVFEMTLMMYTSFGYFDDRENFKVLKEIKRCAKEGGKILIDMPNSEHLQEHFRQQRIKEVFDENGNIKYSIEYNNRLEEKESDLPEAFAEKSLFLVQERTAKYDDGTHEILDPIILRVYTRSQMVALMEKADLEVERITDMDLQAFDSDSSRRMWIHAIKKSDIHSDDAVIAS